MMFRVPDWLSYEIRHKLEGLRDGFERFHIKDRISDHPKAAAIIALAFVVLLASVVSWIVGRVPSRPFRESKRVWFYDLNTGELFSASGKQVGPIAVPSGPLPNGDPAGVRAHVYTYLRDPNESERFIAFLEKPDPNATVKELNPDRSNLKEWSRGRLIKRVGSDTWVAPTSPRGRQIIQQVTGPNAYGKIPIYHTPREPNDTVRYIPLTRGLYALVDAGNYEWLSRHKWSVHDAGKGKARYAVRGCKGRKIFMHREIMKPPPGMVVDHINRNGLDNREDNLRNCTRLQNLQNRYWDAGQSQYRGVCPQGDKWMATVGYDGATIYVGLFDDEVEAARARDRKAHELAGEFAYLNFPHEIDR